MSMGLGNMDEYSGHDRRESERRDTREIDILQFRRTILVRHDLEVEEVFAPSKDAPYLTTTYRYYLNGREIGVRILRDGRTVKCLQVLASPFSGSSEPTIENTVGG